jgi:histidinol-phosphate aminotransferase
MEKELAFFDKIRTVTPYTPGEQPKNQNVIKLNTNENPYPPSPKVQKVLEAFEAGVLRKYPDPLCTELIDALSKEYGVSKDRIFVGVGSDDVLAMSFLTFFNSKKPIVFPDITYSFYDVWADVFRIPYEMIPLKDDFTINTEAFVNTDCGGVVIPNPNAPTGVFLETSAIEEIIKAHQDSVVIIDEAYVDFGGRSVLPLIDKYENLLVVQTFSKSRSLAGSRIGFAFGSEKLIKYLSDVKFSFNSYTMDSITQKIGAAALSDKEYFTETTKKIVKTREYFKKEVSKLGFTFPDSMSNFVFIHHDQYNAKDLFAALKENNIFVRYFDKPRINDYLRVTIGTKEDMDKLLAFLSEYTK